MTPEQRALAAAFLAECWPVCREVAIDERLIKRKSDREEQRVLEEAQIVGGYQNPQQAAS